jgi:hypothetical protein
VAVLLIVAPNAIVVLVAMIAAVPAIVVRGVIAD